MKLFRIFLLVLAAQGVAQAQIVNWSSFKEDQQHIVGASIGYDYSINYEVGYGYKFNFKMPLILNVDHSQPAGNKVFDDFKTRIGGQMRLYKMGDFAVSVKAQGVFRRYANNELSMTNFGSDVSGVIGYYRPHWFAAAEFGFDKAIVTKFKHSDVYKEVFPDVKDGWYETATGGIYYYGLQAGVSFKNNDITLKGGMTLEQDWETKPLIPFYFKIGYNRRF